MIINEGFIGQNAVKFPLNFRRPVEPKLLVGSEKVCGMQKWSGYILSTRKVFVGLSVCLSVGLSVMLGV